MVAEMMLFSMRCGTGLLGDGLTWPKLILELLILVVVVVCWVDGITSKWQFGKVRG